MRDRSARRIRASASQPIRPAWLHPIRLVILLAGLVAALSMTPSAAQANPRYAGLVIDAVSGEVFYQENANRRLYPASLTKMMTLYMTFQALEDGRLSLHQRLTVSSRAASQPPSHLGLPPGSTITVEQAIYALVTKSANDIATVLAEAIGDSEARFARLMTEEARRLGMTRTTFRNASGLPNGEQRTTAWDISRLARALRRDFPQYYHYFATERWRFRGQIYRNHNRLLGSYDGVDGLKTGYIRASGFNLAVSATRGRLSVIAIVFGGRTSQSRNAHMVDLLDRAFDSDRGEYLIAHGSMPFDPPAPPALPDRRIIRLIAGGEAIDLVPPETPEPRADAGPQLIVAVPREEPAEPPLAAPTPPRPPGEPIVLAAAPGGQPVPEALADLPLPPTPPLDMRPDLAQMAARLENTAPTGEPGGDWADGVAPPIAGWGIQVGAFSEVATSRAAMDRAAARLPGMLEGAVPQIAVLDNDGARLFRARLVGLSEQTAVAACARLDSAGQPCMTVAPGE